MRMESNVDPVSRIIKECHRGEDVANRIFQTIAQEHQHRIFLADNTKLELNEEQVGEFVARFSSEVEPQYWHSKRRKD